MATSSEQTRDQGAAQQLEDASRQYETYLELNKLAQLPTSEQEEVAGTRSWDHPLSLTIESNDPNALVE